MNSKTAFSLLELIVAIFIGTIIVIYSFSFSQKLQSSQVINEELAILKLNLNSTKIFIEKNLLEANEKLKYEEETLYFDNKILLKNVSSFSQSSSSNILIIDISLDEKIKQTWKFRL